MKRNPPVTTLSDIKNIGGNFENIDFEWDYTYHDREIIYDGTCIISNWEQNCQHGNNKSKVENIFKLKMRGETFS